jgi:hypothetical protein
MPGTLGQVFPVLSPEDAELSIDMVMPACRESIFALRAQSAGWLVLGGSRMVANPFLPSHVRLPRLILDYA